MNKLENQTLALAGMFQAAALVDELALKGNCSSEQFDCSVNSLFTIEADSTREALGDIPCLTHGFEAMAGYLGGESSAPGRNIAYYLLSILKLAQQILRDDALAEKMLKGLRDIDSSREDFQPQPRQRDRAHRRPLPAMHQRPQSTHHGAWRTELPAQQ